MVVLLPCVVLTNASCISSCNVHRAIERHDMSKEESDSECHMPREGLDAATDSENRSCARVLRVFGTSAVDFFRSHATSVSQTDCVRVCTHQFVACTLRSVA